MSILKDRYDDVERCICNAFYEDYLSIATISNIFRLGKSTIGRILKNNEAKQVSVTSDKLREYHDAGIPVRLLASEFKVTEGTIRKALGVDRAKSVKQ